MDVRVYAGLLVGVGRCVQVLAYMSKGEQMLDSSVSAGMDDISKGWV